MGLRSPIFNIRVVCSKFLGPVRYDVETYIVSAPIGHVTATLCAIAYGVSAQIRGHETLSGIQQDYLKAGRNPQATDTAKLLLTMINEHLALLSDLHRDRMAAL